MELVEPQGVGLMAFLGVLGFCATWWVWAVASTAPGGTSRHGLLAALGLVGWVGATSVPTALGWVTPETTLPGVPLMMGLLLAVGLGLPWTSFGRRLAYGVPLGALVGFQAMRLPLELVLHVWADEGVAPPQMTWTGQNIDIIAGVVALVLAPFAGRSKGAAWASQVVGIVLLANVLRVVVLSIPTPFRQFETPLLLPFGLPTVWIATVCVTGAVLVHGLTVRRLLGR